MALRGHLRNEDARLKMDKINFLGGAPSQPSNIVPTAVEGANRE